MKFRLKDQTRAFSDMAKSSMKTIIELLQDYHILSQKQGNYLFEES